MPCSRFEAVTFRKEIGAWRLIQSANIYQHKCGYRPAQPIWDSLQSLVLMNLLIKVALSITHPLAWLCCWRHNFWENWTDNKSHPNSSSFLDSIQSWNHSSLWCLVALNIRMWILNYEFGPTQQFNIYSTFTIENALESNFCYDCFSWLGITPPPPEIGHFRVPIHSITPTDHSTDNNSLGRQAKCTNNNKMC